MIDILDNILAAHKADNFPIRIHYGGQISKDEIEDQLSQNTQHLRYLITAPEGADTLGLLHNSTGGAIPQMKLWMAAFARSPRDAVKTLHEWFVRLGFVTENNQIGFSGKTPYTYQSVLIHRWYPVGGVNMFSEPYGASWVCDQPIEIAVS